MTLPTAWRYTLTTEVDTYIDATLDARRAAWLAAMDAFRLPAGYAALPYATLVATMAARQAACDAAWTAWHGETGDLAPLAEAS